MIVRPACVPSGEPASRRDRLSAAKPDFAVDTVLGLKDSFDEINGVSMRQYASLNPPPERLHGM
jgi:hypothetical protein